MKKRFLAIAALSLAAATGGTPLLSNAAEVKTVPMENGGLMVYVQGSGEACQIPEGLEESLRDMINFCPETEGTETPCPESPDIEISKPETSCTEAPSAPDTEEPSIPDTEVPSAPETGVPSAPDTEAPSIPDTEVPSAPETEEPSIPDTEVPSAPDTEAPSIPDTEVPSAPETEVPSTPDTEAPSIPDTEVPSAPETEVPSTPETGTPDGGNTDAAQSYASRVVELVNQERAKEGLSALVLDDNVTRAANIRAKEIKQSFSHTRPDGSSFSSVLREQGISYRGSGENIAWGQRSPEEVVEGWMNSEGHRANILNKNFEKIGVGYYQDERGVNYWVQLFTY